MTAHWIVFLLTMLALIPIGVVPANDLTVGQKLKLGLIFFMFGLIGFILGRLPMRQPPPPPPHNEG